MTKVVRSTKMPAKPKYKPMPKAPAMSASVAAWQNYDKRVKAVMKENLTKKAEYDRKVNAVKSVEKIKKDIKARVAKARKKVPFGRSEESAKG